MNRILSTKQTLSNTAPLIANQPDRRISLKYSRHTQLLSLVTDCISSLFRTPPKTTVLILSLALTLPVAIAILSGGFHAAEENLAQNRAITAFLNPQLSDSDARQLASTLAGNTRVQSAALAATQIRGKELKTIDIQPTTALGPAELDNMVRELGSHSSVDYVDADPTWLAKNINAANTTKSLATMSAVVTVLLTILLIFTITRTDLRRKQPDRMVLNQMGVSRSTLVRPQLMRSLMLTLISVGLATFLTWGALTLISMIDDMSIYQKILPDSLPLQRIAWLLVIAALTCFSSVKLLFGNR